MIHHWSIKKFRPGVFTLLFLLTINSCEENPILYKYIVYVDYEVTYQISGENIDSCTIQYFDTDGNQITLHSQPLPWSISFTQNGEFYAHVVAYSINTYDSPGKITATILIDNETLTTSQNEDELVHYISLTSEISDRLFITVKTDHY
ncbi:MAG: MmpS family transport accessory protein [Candidatus Marinimicrobia bacterium]|nr:MmpS family transport accessory protein [Candidatus Neomarinimicrobiota bacterium]